VASAESANLHGPSKCGATSLAEHATPSTILGWLCALGMLGVSMLCVSVAKAAAAAVCAGVQAITQFKQTMPFSQHHCDKCHANGCCAGVQATTQFKQTVTFFRHPCDECWAAVCAGQQATTQFKQTMTFFKPMFRELKARRLPGDLLAGLWMIIDAIQQHNYLYAYDIYMRLAIGTSLAVTFLLCNI